MVRPSSSGERAPASGAGSAGSNPAWGTERGKEIGIDTISTGTWIGFGIGGFFWFLVWLSVIYICFQKGKSGFGWLGIAGFLVPGLLIFPLVGSIRIAKPSSNFATKNYYEGKMTTAVERFPDDTGPHPDWLQHHITFGK